MNMVAGTVAGMATETVAGTATATATATGIRPIRNPRLLVDAFVVESGASPWHPTRTTHEVARYRWSDEIPLVGVVHQAGGDYLYQCVLGQTEEVNIWLYTPLLSSERAAIEAATGRKADELFARYSRRDGRLAIAHNSVGVIAVRALNADGDPTAEVGVLFRALRDYLRKLRSHVQSVRTRSATPRVIPA
jgi:hypothetical protein